MEISDKGGKDAEVDANRESDSCSVSGEHEYLDKDEPDLD